MRFYGCPSKREGSAFFVQTLPKISFSSDRRCRWNGNTITLLTCEGSVLIEGIGTGFRSGHGPAYDTVCLGAGLDALSVEAGGGLFPGDVSWAITFPSGRVREGGAGSWRGLCASKAPTPQPTTTAMPTLPCELYAIELSDDYGDG